MPTICLAQDPVADELLDRDPLALLIGMLLDQHVSRGTEEVMANGGRPAPFAAPAGDGLIARA